MKYLLPSKLYDWLKWIGLAFCPALGILIASLGNAWGFDSEPWVITVDAVGVFIAALIGVSQLTAKQEDDDGGDC